MELKLNMYVRTKSGMIAKYTGFEKDENDDEYNKYNFDGKIFWYYEYYNEYVYEENFEYWFENSVVKTSHNIIDLIEVGDYVNGSKLISIDYAEDEFGNCDKLHFYYQFEDSEKDINEYYDKLEIKSIVTKEQFSSMEYRLGE